MKNISCKAKVNTDDNILAECGTLIKLTKYKKFMVSVDGHTFTMFNSVR